MGWMVVRINNATLKLIKKFEGFRSRAYRDAAGVWTIGYGHTGRSGPPAVRPGMRISMARAEEMLRKDLESFAQEVAALVGAERLRQLNDNQFGALVSFAYNVGVGNFARSSVLRAVRHGRFDEVPRLLMRWTKARDPRTGRLRTLRGLVRRRRAEGHLWLTPPSRKRPPLAAVARHTAGEMAERPGLSAAWAAFVASLANLGIAAWHAAWQPALIGLVVVVIAIIIVVAINGGGEDAAPVEPA